MGQFVNVFLGEKRTRRTDNPVVWIRRTMLVVLKWESFCWEARSRWI